MNCDECLSALATVDLPDMDAEDDLRAHFASCSDCQRVAIAIRAATDETERALARVAPGVSAEAITRVALDRDRIDRRHRMGQMAMIACIALLLLASALIVRLQIIPELRRTQDSRNRLPLETVSLRCLTSEQARDLAIPYLRSNSSMAYALPPGLRAVTLRATRAEIDEAKAVIARFDAAGSCALR